MTFDRRQILGTTVMLALLPALPAFAGDGAREVVAGYLAAWNAHDSAAAAEFFAEDVVYYDASVGTPLTGKEAAKSGVIDNFLTAAPDASWKMRGEPVVEGDRVSFEWEFSGTNTGPWGDGTARDRQAVRLHRRLDVHREGRQDHQPERLLRRARLLQAAGA